MAVKKTIELDVNTSAGLRAMDELGLSFEEAFTEADNLTGQIGELEDALYAMAAAGQQNTKEYDELSKQIGVYKKVIIDTDMQVDALSQTTAQNLGGALGGVASGFELGAGAMGAFGTESEEVEKALLKVASAMAVAQGFQGIREASKSFKGLKAQIVGTTVATKLYSFVQNGLGKSTKVASKGLKVFRGALLATGIGAIIVGIGLLVANFDKVSEVVSGAVAKFRKMGKGMKLLMLPITALIAGFDAVVGALQYLGIIDSEETKKLKANAEERVVSTQREAEEIGKRFDYEIEKARAAGKNTFELEQQKRKEFRRTTLEQIVAIKKLAILNKEYTEEQKKQVKDLYDTISQSAKDSELAVIASDKAKADSYKTYSTNKLNADREIEALKLSMLAEGQFKEIELLNHNAKIKRENLLSDTTKTQDQKEELLGLYETKRRNEEQDIRDKYLEAEREHQIKIAELKGDPDAPDFENGENVEIEAEIFTQDELKRIRNEARANDAAANAEWMQDKIDKSAGYFDAVSQSLTALDDLNTLLTDDAVAKAGDNEEAAEAARKKGFERSKKLQLGMAIITGIQGVMAAFTAGSSMGPAGVVMGPVLAGLAAVTAGINVAKISKMKYEGGSSGGAATGSTTPPRVPQFSIAGNNTSNQLAESLSNQEQAPIKTYVVSGEMSTAQSLDRNKISTASI